VGSGEGDQDYREGWEEQNQWRGRGSTRGIGRDILGIEKIMHLGSCSPSIFAIPCEMLSLMTPFAFISVRTVSNVMHVLADSAFQRLA